MSSTDYKQHYQTYQVYKRLNRKFNFMLKRRSVVSLQSEAHQRMSQETVTMLVNCLNRRTQTHGSEAR